MGMANTSQMRQNHEVENRSLTNQKQPWGGDWTAISQVQYCGEHLKDGQVFKSGFTVAERWGTRRDPVNGDDE